MSLSTAKARHALASMAYEMARREYLVLRTEAARLKRRACYLRLVDAEYDLIDAAVDASAERQGLETLEGEVYEAALENMFARKTLVQLALRVDC